MLAYVIKRLLWMVPSLFVVSFLAFVLIQLPPGDYVTTYIATLAASNEIVDQNTAADLRARFGLDQPFVVQYWKWIIGILLRGDFGLSFEWQQPVSELIWERMGLTLIITVATLLVTWAIALPIGVYSAVRQYSIGDYVSTMFGFIILATSGTASLVRVMRANMLDELHRPYVTTARAKGLSEIRLLIKYPCRLAINPFISTIGWLLPNLVSGALIVSVVMSLPTAGPLLLQSLTSQDMYLAGAFLLLLCVLTLVGTFISDLLLAVVDPRIRYD